MPLADLPGPWPRSTTSQNAEETFPCATQSLSRQCNLHSKWEGISQGHARDQRQRRRQPAGSQLGRLRNL